MLTKIQFLRKLQSVDRIDKNEFIDMDQIYYQQSRDILAVLDFPTDYAHRNGDFRLLAYYYLHRCHTLRQLLKQCAEIRHCYDYEVVPVWVPDFKVSRGVWSVIKSIESASQDSLDPDFAESPENRIAIRHMWSEISVLFREFKSMLKYSNPYEEDVNRVIVFSDVVEQTHHPFDCKNMFCEFK